MCGQLIYVTNHDTNHISDILFLQNLRNLMELKSDLISIQIGHWLLEFSLEIKFLID